MSFWRKLAVGILSPIFVLLLFATAFDIGFTRTATHPAAVKQLVAESGVYDSVVPKLLEQQAKISTPLGDIATSDPLVQKAVQQAITPRDVRQNAEAAIDNLYAWLEGKVPEPTFDFNLTGQKSGFADNVASSVKQKLSAMPRCDSAQSLAIARSGTFDVARAVCLPPGVTAAGAARQVKDYLRNNGDFLSSATISAGNLKNSDGKPLFGQPGVKDIPAQYQRVKRTPVILAVLTILAGGAIIFLSRTRQTGLKHIGLNLLAIGAVMLIFSWALNRIVSNDVTPRIRVDNAILQQDLRSLATDIGQRIDKNYWFFGGLYIVLGAAGIIAAQLALRGRGPGTPGNTAAGYQASAGHPGGPPGAPPDPKAD